MLKRKPGFAILMFRTLAVVNVSSVDAVSMAAMLALHFIRPLIRGVTGVFGSANHFLTVGVYKTDLCRALQLGCSLRVSHRRRSFDDHNSHYSHHWRGRQRSKLLTPAR